jgi:hypothetical protein
VKPVTQLDICIPQSATFRLVITVSGGPTSLSGYTGEMQVRKTKASPEVLADVTADMFTVDDINRQVILEIPDTDTALYDWTGTALYDLYLVGPERWRLLEGQARLDKTVTREG